MMHMSHADMINSEKDFYREMIPHHQEAVDTSVLLFVSTDDPELKILTKSIFKAQTDEILDMRLSYARWYNLIPTGAMYQPMMRDLNIVTGRERDIRYVQDMILHTPITITLRVIRNINMNEFFHNTRCLVYPNVPENEKYMFKYPFIHYLTSKGSHLW